MADDRDDEKPRRKLKVVKKAKSKGNAKGKLKALLKGYFYVFRPMKDEEYSTTIGKLKHSKDDPGKPKPEEEYEITNDTCSCPAGTNGQMCKHVEMVQGRYKGNEFFRDEAEDLLEEWLDTVREKGNKSAAIGELAFGEREKVRRADTILLSPTSCAEELVMFLEYKGLLIRVTCVPDEQLYRRRLSEARIAWSNRKTFI